MNRDWNDFKSLHTNIAGAREAFETACETLFRSIYKGRHVSQVKVNRGDGGIDIFIGEFGIEPIIVIQCKFFLDSFEASQKAQINKSFETAIQSNDYEIEEWILCVPKVIDIQENSWWFKWKHKKIEEYSKDTDFIKIINGNELIDLFKQENLYNKIFKIDDAIKIDEIHKAIVSSAPKKYIKNTNTHLVLFNNYSNSSEPYYLERDVDKIFSNSLKINSVWVFGNSGKGKTVMINRNLSKNEINYCFCDLSPINIEQAEQVIEEILCKIEEKFNCERDNQLKNKIKQIAQILCKIQLREIVIVIDELSVHNDELLKNIANELTNLVVHYYNSAKDVNLKFVVSTISNPKDIIKNLSKASEHFLYIDCNEWEKYIMDLFDLLVNSLSLDIIYFREIILKACENSPRLLKAILRKIITMGDLSEKGINGAIHSTLSESIK